MRQWKITEDQIIYAIRQAESGTPIGDLCRLLRAKDQTALRIRIFDLSCHRVNYNTRRLHGSLGQLTPSEFVNQR